MTRLNYASELLALMSDFDREQYINRNGPEAFVRLWYDAHVHRDGAVPPIPEEIPLGGKVIRRKAFYALGPLAQHEWIRGGGIVIDDADAGATAGVT